MRRALLLLALWPALAGARTYVVAIGSDQGRADEVPLRYATQDAARFVDTLRRLGDVAPTDIVLLREPSSADVLGALDAVSARIGREEAHARLVLYYSGHADAGGLHLGETTLRYDALRERVAASPAEVRLVVLDGCRSGGLTRVKGATPAAAFEIRAEAPAVEGMAVITSSAAGEDSHESERLRGSFFTHHLVAGLVGAADKNRDGRVTLSEVFAYAYEQTLQASGRTARLQHPTFQFDLKGRGDLVLTRPGESVDAARLKLAAPATYLVKGPVTNELTSEAPGAVVALPAGSYFVQERHPDHYREYSVRLERGQTVALGQRPFERVAYARLVRKGGGDGVAHGIALLGGARTPLLDGRSWAPEATLSWSADLPWATLGLRGRFGHETTTVDGAEDTVQGVALGLTAERYFDASWASAGLGLVVEGSWSRQTRDGVERRAWGAGFGLLLSVEVPLWGPLGLRFEAGPMAHVLPVVRSENGAEVGSGVETRAAGFGALGLEVRL